MDVGARQDGEYADLYAFVQPNETATQLLLRCQQERLTTGNSTHQPARPTDGASNRQSGNSRTCVRTTVRSKRC